MRLRRHFASLARLQLALAGGLWLVACSSSEGPTDPGDPVGPPEFLSVSPTENGLTVAADQTVTFQVSALSPAGLPLSYEFRLDGVPVATTAEWSFDPPSPGTYRVEAIVSDGVQEARRAWIVEVQPAPNLPPTVVLGIDPASGPAPLPVRVRLLGADPDGSVVAYRVEILGDAPLVIERAAPIDTTFTLGVGTYEIRGTVTDDGGETAAATGDVQVSANLAPVAELAVAPSHGTAPLDVRVRAGGSDADGTIVRYELDLDGDGLFELASPSPIERTIRYDAAARHWIRMRAIDDRGALGRDSVEVDVSDPAPVEIPPTLTLSVDPASGPAPLAVRAVVTGADADGSVVAVSIDFDGDGQPDASAAAASLTADFTYATPGTYTLQATVTDDDGLAASRTATVTVNSGSNAAPVGSLTASRTEGDATLVVELTASGSDPDGEIVQWEIDADQGAGFVDLGSAGSTTVQYPFRETPYQPRLRLTDDGGATTIVSAPPIRVHRPINADASNWSAIGNPRFVGLQIEPAIWADGQDRMRFTITVRDPAGDPLADVPVQVRSLRPELVAPDGTGLGGTVTISLDGTRTDAAGVLTGELTTHTSGRVFAAPVVGAFEPFALMVEADAGHGEWRRLADIEGLNAETVVSGNPLVGQFYILPQGLTCVGQEVEIHVQGIRRSDAPSPGTPAGGLYTEIRYAGEGPLLQVQTAPGYESWRTDSGGWIVFRYTPPASDFRTIRAWVDGQPLNITVGLAAKDC